MIFINWLSLLEGLKEPQSALDRGLPVWMRGALVNLTSVVSWNILILVVHLAIFSNNRFSGLGDNRKMLSWKLLPRTYNWTPVDKLRSFVINRGSLLLFNVRYTILGFSEYKAVSIYDNMIIRVCCSSTLTSQPDMMCDILPIFAKWILRVLSRKLSAEKTRTLLEKKEEEKKNLEADWSK